MKKGVFTGLFCGISLLCGMVLSYGAEAPAQATGTVSFPEPIYAFDPVFEGQPVSHDFVVQNKGTGVLDVKRVAGG